MSAYGIIYYKKRGENRSPHSDEFYPGMRLTRTELDHADFKLTCLFDASYIFCSERVFDSQGKDRMERLYGQIFEKF